ncbi:MBL fold metallo-hydrolase [Bacillaceae bacterium Marseille-Q3522]|nr:MBL fold metallo-hydrolase [Bacillaceae bacterium Marseille-Q3522]
MKLTTIGYWGAYPQKNEATSCYLIEEQGTNILLDCGSGALSKLQNFIQINDLNAVFISHIHPDHMADIYCLEFALLIQKQLGYRIEPLDVYIYSDKIDKLPFAYPEVMRVHQISLQDIVEVGPLRIAFSENRHEIPCCSMKVSNQNGAAMVYSADTGYTTEIIDFSIGVDLLLIECSFYKAQKGLVKGHLSSSEVAEIINGANAKEVVLTHFPHFGQIKQLEKEVKSLSHERIYQAKEGFSITI